MKKLLVAEALFTQPHSKLFTATGLISGSAHGTREQTVRRHPSVGRVGKGLFYIPKRFTAPQPPRHKPANVVARPKE